MHIGTRAHSRSTHMYTPLCALACLCPQETRLCTPVSECASDEFGNSSPRKVLGYKSDDDGDRRLGLRKRRTEGTQADRETFPSTTSDSNRHAAASRSPLRSKKRGAGDAGESARKAPGTAGETAEGPRGPLGSVGQVLDADASDGARPAADGATACGAPAQLAKGPPCLLHLQWPPRRPSSARSPADDELEPGLLVETWSRREQVPARSGLAGRVLPIGPGGSYRPIGVRCVGPHRAWVAGRRVEGDAHAHAHSRTDGPPAHAPRTQGWELAELVELDTKTASEQTWLVQYVLEDRPPTRCRPFLTLAN